MATKTAYKFENKDYTTWDSLCQAVMESHPELLDDEMVDFIESEVEEVDYITCDACGDFIPSTAAPFLKEKGCCSWRCIQDLYDYS